MVEALLEVRGLAKRFASGRGVRDVSLSAPGGCVTAFIGANGAGKSTTLRCILGLLKPDAGSITLFGQPAEASTRRRIGFMPEERGLSPSDRARDVIAFHGRLKGMPKRNAFAEADRLLERIGLGGRQRAKIESLSKGNAQRVQVLCALVHRPSLLILDEPLSGLDPKAQAEMLSLFSEFRGEGGAILFSTHSMLAAERACDRVVMLSNGQTVFEGLTDEARACAPHGAVVVTSDGEALAAAAARIGAEVRLLAGAIGEAARWRVGLPREVTHPALMRALAEFQVPIFDFQPIEAGLEGAFWELTSEPVAPEPSDAPERLAA